MTDCKSPWAALASLGITLIFAARKARRKEALEKAEQKAELLKAAIASMRKRNES
jgi:hypothetical protein